VSDEAAPGLSALVGLRVVEMGVWVAAPSAAALLADWGADVIKVEAPAGDPMRHVFGSLGIDSDMPNPAFALDNRGKRSVVLNLRSPRTASTGGPAGHGRRLHHQPPARLPRRPRPRACAATVARHGRLVYCSISGYGLRGDDRNRPTYDIGAFWARSGLSVQMADSNGSPLNARGGIGDHITGLAALAGLLAAVMEQRETGRGRVVEVSLLRTGTYVLGWDLGLQMTARQGGPGRARDRNQAPLMNPYRAGDGRWFFFTGLEAARHIGRRVPGPRPSRTARRPALRRRFAIRRNRPRSSPSWTRSSPSIPWSCGPSGSTRRACGGPRRRHRPRSSTDPQLLVNDGIAEIDGGGTGTVQRSVNGPVSFSDLAVHRYAAVPARGQHTDEVLRELAGRSESPPPAG
jgi:crotonobetainyl-CoA:carnitine CoA-transferase CaiB-like acyl-CoA transferase